MAANRTHTTSAKSHVTAGWHKGLNNLSIVKKDSRGAVSIVGCPATQLLDLIFLPAFIDASMPGTRLEYPLGLQQKIDPISRPYLDRQLEVRSTSRTFARRSSL
jgi:hypothetical protein